MEKQKSKVDIIDLNRYRKNKNQERKREFERVVFNRILGVYSFLEDKQLHSIEIKDISQSGVRFHQYAPEKEHPEKSTVTLRLYFTPSSFLRVVVKIQRVNAVIDHGRKGIEYGCEFDEKTKSFKVVEKLVTFLHSYSEVACQDPNPPLNFY